MSTTSPSIQTFYSREEQSSFERGRSNALNSRITGDGFTSSEVEAVTDPLSRSWKPPRSYERCPISLLQTGPFNYEISGRIVNFSNNPPDQGYHSLVVSDGSGAIAVKLYYGKASDYQLLLGQRVTLWATFIANSAQGSSGNIPFCASSTKIYPGRNIATHITLYKDPPDSDGHRILRCPLDCNLRDYSYLPALMTLKAYLSTGYDMAEGKILVCVRSVGPRRTVHSKKRQCDLDMVDVSIFDDTATCILKLWQDKVHSAKTWIPNQTILLISKPTCREEDPQSGLGLGYNSIVEVDPEFPDADWLRNKVKSMKIKQSIYIPFPVDIWDVDLAIHGPNPALFTIADIEDQVRNPEFEPDFTGKLNVIIVEMGLMEQWRKRTFCCFECCGMPVYANKPVAICKNCDMRRNLSPNPRIIGSMIDESGMIMAGKLVWHDDAWTQLFFGGKSSDAPITNASETDLVEQSWEDLTIFDTAALRDIEERLLYTRITLTFGWSSQLERLCIMGVEW
ncbi:hypothetical protein F4774DRAFT_416690 [Daldinia eschscholtzii]|nr:hypothetical protein F4774DRAFT_416690 [Daldinia eschscholtzii]